MVYLPVSQSMSHPFRLVDSLNVHNSYLCSTGGSSLESTFGRLTVIVH